MNNSKIIGAIIFIVLISIGILGWRYWWWPETNIKISQETLTEEEAVELVKNLSEVKEWLSLFSGPGGAGPTTDGKPVIVVDNKRDGEYLIHVYEQTPDHTATFNWYGVNIKSGKVVPLFSVDYE